MPVDMNRGVLAPNYPKEGPKSGVTGIKSIVDAKRRSMRDQQIQGLSSKQSAPHQMPFQLHCTPQHFRWRVLMRPAAAWHRTSQPCDDEAAAVWMGQRHDTAVNIDSPFREMNGPPLSGVKRAIVITRNIEQWHMNHCRDVFQVGKRQISARYDKINAFCHRQNRRRVQHFAHLITQDEKTPTPFLLGHSAFLEPPEETVDSPQKRPYTTVSFFCEGSKCMQMHKGDQELVRNQNRALVINLLRLHGSMSRSEVAERTGLAPSALTRLCRDLLAEGVVIETGKSGSTGGRPAVLVALNPEYSRSIGIKVERGRVLGAAVDLAGNIRDRATIFFDTSPSPDNVIDAIAEIVNRLSFERLLGVGISISGFVDPSTGMDLFSPILGWRNVPLRDPISEKTGLPVWIENDVNALALAERWYGAGREFRHFICITVGEGIGAGVVIGGEIYRGAFGGAGELGHITINPDGPVCRCQERGCLEVYASDHFLAEEATRLGFPNIQELIDAAHDSNSDAKVAFERMGRYLGFGAKNLVNLLNPEAIILGGERMDASDLFLSAIEEEVRRHSFPSEADRLQIVTTELGADGFLIGSATLVTADFFRVPAKGTIS